MVSFVLSANGGANGVVNGFSFSFDRNHVNYKVLIEALKKQDGKTFLDNYDVVKSVKAKFAVKGHNVEIRNDVVYYNDEVLHTSLATRIVDMLRQGFDVQPMVNFLTKLMSNPSKRAIDELYNFLSYKNLPITSDGDFLAYKCVRENYLDKHSGKFDNSPGAILEMPRNNVDDNCNNTCSYGFHAGSLEYSGPQGAFWQPSDQVVIVKINPADVVSIPSDYNAQKLRTCKYEVIGDYQGPLSKAVYSGKSVNDVSYDKTEYADAKVVIDDNYLSVHDLNIGDEISFGYELETRHAMVEDFNYERDLLVCRLISPEWDADGIRNFKFDKISKIVLKD